MVHIHMSIFQHHGNLNALLFTENNGPALDPWRCDVETPIAGWL
jgi:hypothetical protein